MILPWHISAVSSNLWFSSFLNQRHPLAFDNPQRAFPSCPDSLNSPRFPWLVREGSPRPSNTETSSTSFCLCWTGLWKIPLAVQLAHGGNHWVTPPLTFPIQLLILQHSTALLIPPSWFLPAHSPCILWHFLQQLFNSFINVTAPLCLFQFFIVSPEGRTLELQRNMGAFRLYTAAWFPNSFLTIPNTQLPFLSKYYWTLSWYFLI